MKTININDNLTVISDGDINHPIVLNSYFLPPHLRKDSLISGIQLVVQIFHTDLKHFDLRKAKLMDPDTRRPIFLFKFDDVNKYSRFIEKTKGHMLAVQQIELAKINGQIEPAAGHVVARDLYRLRSFTAWLEHISTGEILSNYVADCAVEFINGGMALSIPDITFDDFIACLREEKSLTQSGKNIDPNKEFEIDDIKMSADTLVEHIKRKTILEQMDACTEN